MENSLDPLLSDEVLYARFTCALNECNIDEFGILPFIPNKADTRPEWHPFLVDDSRTKLGMPMVCWAPLIGAAYGVLKPIMNSNCLVGQPWWKKTEELQRVIESTRCLMALCPDSYVAMNARKRLVREGVLDPSKELEYLDAVLTITRNCKSAGVWHHRKWLLCFMHPTIDTTPLDTAVIEQHLTACHRAAEIYPKCYYAWTTRHWLVDQLSRAYKIPSTLSLLDTQGKSSDNSGGEFDVAQMAMIAEWQRMGQHVERNVSDHSSFQHFQHLLLKMSGRYVVHNHSPWEVRWTKEESVVDTVVESGEQHQLPVAAAVVVKQADISGVTERNVDGNDKFDAVALCWDRKALYARRRCGRGRLHALEQQIEQFQQDRLLHQGQVATVTENVMVEESLWQERFVHKLWQSEADRVRRLIASFPGHETLWYHLRFVYYGLRWLDSVISDGEQDLTPTEYVTPATEQLFVQKIVGCHVKKVETEKVDEGDPSTRNRAAATTAEGAMVESLQAQQECSERYLTWVNRLDL